MNISNRVLGILQQSSKVDTTVTLACDPTSSSVWQWPANLNEIIRCAHSLYPKSIMLESEAIGDTIAYQHVNLGPWG